MSTLAHTNFKTIINLKAESDYCNTEKVKMCHVFLIKTSVLYSRVFEIVLTERTRRVGLPDFEREAMTECSRSDEARIASFLNDFKDEPLNTRIREESLKMNVFASCKIGSVFLSHLTDPGTSADVRI